MARQKRETIEMRLSRMQSEREIPGRSLVPAALVQAARSR
jgi:hypothetical protein